MPKKGHIRNRRNLTSKQQEVTKSQDNTGNDRHQRSSNTLPVSDEVDLPKARTFHECDAGNTQSYRLIAECELATFEYSTMKLIAQYGTDLDIIWKNAFYNQSNSMP
jgi:hypothetical protein